VQIDNNNCGACGNVCGPGLGCFGGMCQAGPSYVPVGPQLNVPLATVTNGGWVECYRDLYNNSATPMATITGQCNRNRVMVGCRRTGAATIQLLAWAPRTDVFFDTGNGNNNVHPGNGTDWYYSTGYSMGFVAAGTGVSRNSCDTGNAMPDQRLCFHTGGGNINGGYRCGQNAGLNGDVNYERVFYHAN
jgi:hypothetical protein